MTRKEWAGEFAAMTGSIIRNSTFDSPQVKEMDRKIGWVLYTVERIRVALCRRAGLPDASGAE